MRKRRKKKSQQRISEKIEHLRHEGYDQKQAIGMAYGMEREGRLGRHGKYFRGALRRKREEEE